MSRQRQAGRLTVVTSSVCVCVLEGEWSGGGRSPGFPSAVVTGVVGLLQLSNESLKGMAGLVTAAWQVDRNLLASVEDGYSLYSIKLVW